MTKNLHATRPTGLLRSAALAVALLAGAHLSGCTALSPAQQARQAEAAQPFLTAPLIRVDVPARASTAVLRPIGENGEVTTWTTVDEITLSFRRGVLVASRGLGFDLMAADPDGTIAALRGEGPEIYRRKMRFLTGDDHSTWLTAGCTMTPAGEEVGLRRFEESCQARGDSFTNVFLLDGSGRVAQSRQWLSPELGYLDIAPFSLPQALATDPAAAP